VKVEYRPRTLPGSELASIRAGYTDGVLARARSQPAWVIALAFGLAAGGVVVADQGHHSPIAGAVAILLVVGLVATLYRRPDREGWGIYSVMLLPSLALEAVDWPAGIEAVVYVTVATLLAAACFDTAANPERSAPAQSRG
jgi:hypothetical protein